MKPSITRVEDVAMNFATVQGGLYNSPASDSYPSVRKVTVITKTPNVTPDYKSIVRRRIRLKPLHYFHGTYVSSALWGLRRVDTWEGGQHYLSDYRQGQQVWRGGPPVFKQTVQDAIDDATSKAVAKLLANAKDSKFNGAQAYAESGQVAKMIGDFAHTAARFLTQLRRGNLIAAGNVVGLTIGKRAATRYRTLHHRVKNRHDIDQMLASGILQIQYGIRPLIQDVIGAAELYAQKNVQEQVTQAKGSSTSFLSETWSLTSPRGVSQSAEFRAFVKTSYGCTFSKSNEVLHTAKQLGLTNPLLLAWELMPWSFVIDWFLPVGDYLTTLDATLGLKFESGYFNTKIVTTQSRTQGQLYVPVNPMHGDTISESSESFESRTEFTRSVIYGWPSASLPSFKNPLSLEHALNGFALLAGFKKTVYNR